MADRYFSFNINRQDEFEDKINLDSLFERKRQINQSRLSVYQKILHRVHERIKHTARQKDSEDFCFYVVPEFMFGVPRYDVATCISYIMEQLQENGFVVKYTHPNLLFISWKHYIPAYKREEIRKRTGYRIDGFGKVLSVDAHAKRSNGANALPASDHGTIWDKVGGPSSASGAMSGSASSSHPKKQVSFREDNTTHTTHNTSSRPTKQYRDTKSYRPTGNMVYDEDVIQSLNKKLKLEDTVELQDIDIL